MEVVVHEDKKFIWELVDDNVVEELTDHEEIGLWGLILIFSTRMRRGLLEKGLVSFHIYSY